MPNVPEYFDALPSACEIDWSTQGDPLIAYLRDAMPVHIVQTPWVPADRVDEADDSSFGICFYSEELATKLIFAFTVNGILPVIEVSEPESSGEEVDVWKSALSDAYGKLSEEEPEFEWIAAIGAKTGELSEVPFLVEGFTVGQLTVECAREPYTEAVDSFEHPTLGGFNIVSSYPLLVRGRSRGYDWDIAKYRALGDLNNLCALLSLEFDTHWRIRWSPQTHMPADFGLPTWGIGMPNRPGAEHVLGCKEEVYAPSWLDTAWAQLREDEVLYWALHAHRQATALMRESPSFALLCFVGAIEGIGSTMADLEPCEYCKMDKGAGKRYRKALKTVYTNREAKRFERSYSFRSKTAHSGIMHGGEGFFGGTPLIFSSFGGLPPAIGFRSEVLWDIRGASKKVIVKYVER